MNNENIKASSVEENQIQTNPEEVEPVELEEAGEAEKNNIEPNPPEEIEATEAEHTEAESTEAEEASAEMTGTDATEVENNSAGDTAGQKVNEVGNNEDIDEEEIELWDDLTTKSAIEALLFVSDDPLTKNEIAKLVKNADKATINRAITQLSLEYTGDRGIHLSEIDGGLQFRTNAGLSEVILRMYEAKPLRLSKAILETLAIVAYQQPVTKARADEIRGVDCSGSLKKLIGFDLVSVIGRADDIGRPNLYATTTRFLEFFGMNSITDMPTLEEFEVDALELVGEDLREFLPEDERESILAGHVSEGEVEREERTHELGGGGIDEEVESEKENENTEEQVEVYPSSAANDDGVLKEEEE